MRSSRKLYVACGLLAAAGWLIGLAPPVSAGTVVQYDFNDTSSETSHLEASTAAPGLTALDITKASLDAFTAFKSGSTGGAYETSLLRVVPIATNAANAVTNNAYFEFTVEVDPGASLNLEKLTFDAAKGGSSGTRGWVVRSSLNGFGSNLATQTVSSVRPNLTAFTVNLGSDFQDLTTPLTFRIYSFSSVTASSGASLEYDNITLHGFVAAPEPGTLALALSGLMVLPAVAWRRYRRGGMAGRSTQ